MFVDASAMCAILLEEPERDAFADKIEAAQPRLTSAIAIYETAMALARHNAEDAVAAGRRVQTFLALAKITVIPIDQEIAAAALEAHARFGKSRHAARLNMGDCFAYACARVRGEPLLYKGGDFSLTDIAAA